MIDLYMQQGLDEKAKLTEQSGHIYTFAYFLNGFVNYFYGHLLPSTGYVSLFELVPYFNGLLLQVPKRKRPNKLYKVVKQDKLFDIYQEHKEIL